GASGQALQNLNLMMGLSPETKLSLLSTMVPIHIFLAHYSCTLRRLKCLLFYPIAIFVIFSYHLYTFSFH
ncbi:hypothetical protein ACJX0J_009704, partial [Zea mays]